MHIKLGTRLLLANIAILGLAFAAFAPLLVGNDLGILLIFSLLNAVANLILIPLLLPWICLRDLRAIQKVIGGIKRGDHGVELEAVPEPHDPDDEYELNRLKREILWMRRAILLREQDIRRQTERIQALNETLRIEAITDKLTGLFNARFFWVRIGDCFNDHLRTGELFAFAILDIDFFKRINDTYGHPGGDRVLEQFAQTLRENTRKTDVVARIGGEEFALILRHLSASDTQTYLRRLQARLREQHIQLSAETRIKITVSIGYYYVIAKQSPSTIGEHPSTAQDIVKRADAALYWVKNNGRDDLMAWHELSADYRAQRLREKPAELSGATGTGLAVGGLRKAGIGSSSEA